MITKILAFLTLAALLLLTGCDGKYGPESEDGLTQHVIILVFDPTVLEKGQEDELHRWIGKLEKLYEKIPESSVVAVYFIGHGVVQADPLEVVFDIDVDYDGEDRHAEQVKEKFREVREALETKWKEAHEESQVTKPDSCIVSSLFAVEDYLDRYAGSEEKRDFSLFLFSDMIESCDESGSLINLARGDDDFQRLQAMSSRPDLSALSGAYVVQLPSRLGMTPQGSRRIRSAWESLLKNCGLPKDRLHYSTSFPANLGLGT